MRLRFISDCAPRGAAKSREPRAEIAEGGTPTALGSRISDLGTPATQRRAARKGDVGIAPYEARHISLHLISHMSCKAIRSRGSERRADEGASGGYGPGAAKKPLGALAQEDLG